MKPPILSLIASAGLLAAFVPTVARSATLSPGYTPGAGSQLLTTNGGGGTTLFNDSAATGGDDVNGTGASFYSVLLDGSGDWSIGQTVSITGIAMTLLDSGTADGTFTFDIREGAGGNGASGTADLDSIGTRTATYTSGSGTSLYYVNFDTPVTFVADANSTSIVINWSSTAQIRWKKFASPGGDRLPQVNYGNGNFAGGDDTVAFSVAGAVVPEPSVALLGSLALLGLLRRRR